MLRNQVLHLMKIEAFKTLIARVGSSLSSLILETKNKWILVNLTGNTYVRYSSHCLILSLKPLEKKKICKWIAA